MEVRAAIGAAKKIIADVFSDEGVRDIRLEEVKFDPAALEWWITVGFFRPTPSQWMQLPGTMIREFKTVVLDDEGRMREIKHREVAN